MSLLKTLKMEIMALLRHTLRTFKHLCTLSCSTFENKLHVSIAYTLYISSYTNSICFSLAVCS